MAPSTLPPPSSLSLLAQIAAPVLPHGSIDDAASRIAAELRVGAGERASALESLLGELSGPAASLGRGDEARGAGAEGPEAGGLRLPEPARPHRPAAALIATTATGVAAAAVAERGSPRAGKASERESLASQLREAKRALEREREASARVLEETRGKLVEVLSLRAGAQAELEAERAAGRERLEAETRRAVAEKAALEAEIGKLRLLVKATLAERDEARSFVVAARAESEALRGKTGELERALNLQAKRASSLEAELDAARGQAEKARAQAERARGAASAALGAARASVAALEAAATSDRGPEAA